jgi:hypothetical protein
MDHKIYHHLPLQDPPKFTQIWIFGLKTNHLATLVDMRHKKLIELAALFVYISYRPLQNFFA